MFFAKSCFYSCIVIIFFIKTWCFSTKSWNIHSFDKIFFLKDVYSMFHLNVNIVFFRWTYLSRDALSAKSAKYTSPTKWHSTKKARKGMLPRVGGVMTVNNKVLVVKPSPSSERRYGFNFQFINCYFTNNQYYYLVLANLYSWY